MSENRKGNISIHAQNIMPVIKRWLYSDQDIFIRELVANGCDAVTKFRMTGTPVEEELKVTVTVDKDAGELRFEDNGIGMSADEVEKYINQVAFSGAEEFLKNYQGNEDGGIIGHFGLGFYSAFMPADKVTIDTQSWQANEAAVRWESADGMAYEMSESKKTGRGTVITLHINEESKEFLEGYRVREVLDRYCGYMAVPIYLVDVKEEALKAEEAAKKAAEAKDGEEVKEPAAPAPINDTHPLWLKAPKDCTEDEYKDAYRKLFNTFEEPLFWIHLNVDYPFNLKGILYFPRIRKDFGGQEGQIKLFNRQVFVADNIKEIIPEFLLLLRGVLDCPDLPLNVSRSFLQNDGYVKKLSAHITKKVADKLNALMNT
ncbi:MAG: molecular chaperone HtpG, partial [Clostridia bacterium]|nr:molecular chaperone HtpG [Clostridia bacterium]